MLQAFNLVPRPPFWFKFICKQKDIKMLLDYERESLHMWNRVAGKKIILFRKLVHVLRLYHILYSFCIKL